MDTPPPATPFPEPVPPREPVLPPPVFRHDGKLFVSTGCDLPDVICICCGAPAAKTKHKTLRNPFNPLTWIGAPRRLRIGLCRKHLDSYQVALALTFSVLGLGIVMIGVGAFTGSINVIVFGLLAVLCCGVFRARVPVWSPVAKAEPVEVRGTGKHFRELFPHHDGGVG